MQELFSLNQNILSFKRIILVCTPDSVPRAVLKLLNYNIKVDFIGVASVEAYESEMFNIPVAALSELSGLNADTAVVVFSPATEDIVKKLEELGYSNIFFDYFSELGVTLLEREQSNRKA